MVYSAQEKIDAAKALENARAQVRIKGGNATETDKEHVKAAEKKYLKVTGKKPPKK
jgi:hypothetical protein